MKCLVLLTHLSHFFLRIVSVIHTITDSIRPPHRTINMPDATSISISLLLALDL